MVAIDKTWGDYLEFGATSAVTAVPLLLMNPVGWTALGTATVVGGAVSAGFAYARGGSTDEIITAGLSTGVGTLLGGAVVGKVLPWAGRLFGSKAGPTSKQALEKTADDLAREARKAGRQAQSAEREVRLAEKAAKKGGKPEREAAIQARKNRADKNDRAIDLREDAAAAKVAAAKAPQPWWERLGIPAATNGGAQSRWPQLAGGLIGNNVGHYLGYPASLSKVPVKEVVGLSRPGMEKLMIPDLEEIKKRHRELEFAEPLNRYLAGDSVA